MIIEGTDVTFLAKEFGYAPVMPRFPLGLDALCPAAKAIISNFEVERALDHTIVHVVQVDSDKVLVGGRYLDPELRPLDLELLGEVHVVSVDLLAKARNFHPVFEVCS